MISHFITANVKEVRRKNRRHVLNYTLHYLAHEGVDGIHGPIVAVP